MTAIEYNVKLDDLIAFSDFDWQQSENIQKSLRRHRSLWPLICLAAGLFSLLVLGRADTMMRLGLLAIAWAVIVPRLVRFYFRWRCVKASEGSDWQRLVGSHQLEMDGDELLTTAPNDQQSRIRIGDVQSIEGTDTHIFLYIESGGALILPKKAIEPRQLENMLDGIRAHLLPVNPDSPARPAKRRSRQE